MRNLLLVLNIESIMCPRKRHYKTSKWLTSLNTTLEMAHRIEPSLDVYAAEWNSSCSQVKISVHSLVPEKHQQQGKITLGFALSIFMMGYNVFSFIDFDVSKIKSKGHRLIELLTQTPLLGNSSHLTRYYIDILEYQ